MTELPGCSHKYQRYTKHDFSLGSVIERSPYSGMIFGTLNNESENPIIKSEIPAVNHITSCIIPQTPSNINGTFKPYVSNPKYMAKNSSTEVKDNSVNCVVELPGIVKGNLVIYPLGDYSVLDILTKKIYNR